MAVLHELVLSFEVVELGTNKSAVLPYKADEDGVYRSGLLDAVGHRLARAFRDAIVEGDAEVRLVSVATPHATGRVVHSYEELIE